MSKDLLESWGESLKAFRSARGFTMDTFAREMGVSVATVSRWEGGKMAPKDDNKVEIANLLGVDVRTIFPLPRTVTA